MKKKILNLGSGLTIIPGADGLDLTKLPTVKFVHNMNVFPYPIKTNTYDEIYCHHILEHVDDMIKVMEEIYRIGKHRAKVFIRGPHASCSSTVWIDPTHKRGLSTRMFRDYFSQTGRWSFYTAAYFDIESIRLNYVLTGTSSRIPQFISIFLTNLANINQTSQELCERLWSSWVGGFEEIEVILTIDKSQKKTAKK